MHSLQHVFIFTSLTTVLPLQRPFNLWSRSAHCQSLHPRGSFPSMGTLVVTEDSQRGRYRVDLDRKSEPGQKDIVL